MKTKEIHFYVDKFPRFSKSGVHHSHTATKRSIDNRLSEIRTTSLVDLSFNLIDYGYDIYVHWNGICLKMYPGMDTVSHKDIRSSHNLVRLLLGGYFNPDFNIK